MKSIKFFAVASAVALLSTAGFTSCKEKNGPVGPNNLTDGEVVKTEFSIAIPEAGSNNNGGVMRMPSTTAQVNPTGGDPFRGMVNMVLIPFSSAPMTSSSVRYGNNITLPGATAAANNTLPAGGLTNQGAKYYSNVSIPLGTKGFLFYAKAAEAEISGASEDKVSHTYGELSPVSAITDNTNPSSIQFKLTQINDDGAPIKGTYLVNYLNTILDAKDNNNTPADATDDVKWNDCATFSPALSLLYTKLSKLNAGSSNSIQYALSDLAKSLHTQIDLGVPGSNLAQAVLDSIDAKASIAASPSYAVTLDAEIAGYPGDIHLPDGAAGIAYDTSSKHFALVSTSNSSGLPILSDASINHGLTNYVYPAALYYFANSAIKVSNSSKKDLYVADKPWTGTGGILPEYQDGVEVVGTTRSVAIENQIQYAVGRMDLTTRIKSDVTALNDNDPSDPNDLQSFAVNSATSIPVTAVFVGGQKNVDFQFEPVSGDAPVWTIYDNEVPEGFSAKNTASSLTNYTLVLETAAEAKIMIAIELTNNLGDFYGVNNQLIPEGSKFYLLAELDPMDVTTTDPAHDGTASDGANTGNRVFKQDFHTIVNLQIGANSLKKAYNTIPDLRSPQLELGFSVDLTWRDGMSFDIEL